MRNAPSPQQLLIVHELIRSWPDFDYRTNYYISIYLPGIIKGTIKPTPKESDIISRVGSNEDLIRWVENTSNAIKIRGALGRGDFDEADNLYRSHEDSFPGYAGMRAAAVYENEKIKLRQVKEELKKYEFDKAERIFADIQNPNIQKEYFGLAKEFRTRQEEENRRHYVVTMIAEIKARLDAYDFTGAEEIYSQISSDYPADTYRQLVNTKKREFDKKRLVQDLSTDLENGSYESADAKFWNSDLLSKKEYQNLRLPYIRKTIGNRFKIDINNEKAYALASMERNLLISARAGSGKTTVVACKTGILIDCYGTNPDQLLILAFNKKAAGEIRARIRKEMGLDQFENARTFHSLAHQLIKPKKKALFDDGTDEFSQSKLSNFVKALLRDVWTPQLKKKMYEFFRRELDSIERAGTLLNDADYYVYVRNLREIALSGDRVKSKGEKYLADFLFEHDIPFAYESVEFWNDHNYYPDFSLFAHKITIEFWGIDEFDSDHKLPSWWDKSWYEYHAQMLEKRKYWREKGTPLIEFSVADLKGDRIAFEDLIKTRLRQAGVVCEKLPQEELENRVIRNQVDRFTKLLVQFIQKAKKRALAPEVILDRLSTYHTADARERIFLEIASRIYSDYQSKLEVQEELDFDDFLTQAASLIEDSHGECSINLGTHKDRTIRMNDLKWILIDEYQDFSTLFFNLIQAIRSHNPQVQLLCVGDDWQSINSFAGSDLSYFTKFGEVFPAGNESLLTNFRSQKSIIEGSNFVMRGRGKPGERLTNKQGGVVIKRRINEIWVELRKDREFEKAKQDDDRFVFYDQTSSGQKIKDNGYINARYLKACFQIITEKENWDELISNRRSKRNRLSVAILSRTTYLERITLPEFKHKLYSCFTSDQRQQIGDLQQGIQVGTVHSFKGLEADLVIILRANEGYFPLIHADNNLFKFFGQTEGDILEEERRLFYVAMTRAAERLYFLTEADRESPFLKDMPIVS